MLGLGNGYCWELTHQLNTVRECITLICCVTTLQSSTGLRALLVHIVLKRRIPLPLRLHAFKHRTCIHVCCTCDIRVPMDLV